jgi:hypothetical protein
MCDVAPKRIPGEIDARLLSAIDRLLIAAAIDGREAKHRAINKIGCGLLSGGRHC